MVEGNVSTMPRETTESISSAETTIPSQTMRINHGGENGSSGGRLRSTFGGESLRIEPQSRLRANTWPVKHEQEDEDDDDRPKLPTLPEESGSGSSSVENTSQTVQSEIAPTTSKKKNSARRNPWGNMSYADLIEKAIDSVADKRLTLSQIYDWLMQNVPFFKEKADSNSSAGWKNSVRHNLSLHNRFMRVQNETGTGKSSWWMVNQSAKFDKPSRRRAASMETKEYEKRKGRMKKINVARDSDAGRHDNSISPIAGPMTPDAGTPYQRLSVSDFRSRASSNASSYGCLSPKSPGPEDHSPQTLSPQPWSAGYDPAGSQANRVGMESFGHNYESEFSNQLSKNVRLSENRAAQNPVVSQSPFDNASSKMYVGPAIASSGSAIGNYHPLLANGFLPPAYHAPQETISRNYFAGQFATIPEEPRMAHHAPSHPQYFHPKTSALNHTGTATVVNSTTGVSGGAYTTFNHNPAGYPNWSLPHDLESFAEPVHGFDFDWEELLQQEAAIERANAAAAAANSTTHN